MGGNMMEKNYRIVGNMIEAKNTGANRCQFKMTLEEFKRRLRFWNQLTNDQVGLMWHMAVNDIVIFVTGPHGPTGKTSLVARLCQLGAKAIEIDVNDIIVLDKIIEVKKDV